MASTLPTGELRVPASPPPVASLRGVAARRGGRPALTVDRLDLPAGAVCAVVGPNGSGKSTLLHVLAGLLAVGGGEVRVLGQPPTEVRARIAYVLQATAVDPHLPVTVRDVVAMGRYPARGPASWTRPMARPGRRADRAAVDAAMERLELGGLARRYLGELSGGQRQRALVAQGLVQGGDLLLLDEPVSGLDLASAERIGAIVTEERDAGRTVVVATHDLTEAASADRVVLLSGRVVAGGVPAAVLTRAHLAAAYGERLLRVSDDLLVVDEGAQRRGGAHCDGAGP